MRTRRVLIVSLLAACLAPQAWAQSHPAVGEWIGQVSWSDPRLFRYSWQINADGTFSSGRFGRGHDGEGVWSASGEILTLTYSDGFRYEGKIEDGLYIGTAHYADGRELGGFSMQRVPDDVTSDEQGQAY